MKKSKINLIVNREDYQKFENYFGLLKLALIGVLLIFFVIFLGFAINIKSKNDEEKDLNTKKKNLLLELGTKKEDEAKISYIGKKYQDLTDYLKDDAFSLPYFELLNSALSSSSESARLKSFLIEKNREVDFTIAFTDFAQLRNSFQLIESENFLKNFETISLKSFTVVGATENKEENYELSFSGIFVPLKQSFFD